MKKTVAVITLSLALGPLLPSACNSPGATPTATTLPTALPAPPSPTLPPGDASTLPWWSERVFYEVFVRSFCDSDGDGIGDLQGLTSKLDYLNDGDPESRADLGVTGVWLMPVAESPSYHGYDVVDYMQVERDYGTHEDLQQFIAAAHQRGIVVIVDLVMNHTSSQHPWFLDAQTPGSMHDAWYVWQAKAPLWRGPWGQAVWHKAGERYYYGLFWEGMPDLNYENPAVTDAMYDVTRFWLQDMGVDGFRLDAIKHLIEDGQTLENTPATHAWLEDWYRFLRAVDAKALTVGEVWSETAEVVEYVGDEIDVAFEFDLAQAILSSILSENKRALVAAQARALELYQKGQYAVFLTNHDQERVMTQLENDLAAAKLAATLLLTNPGLPFIYYGEEVGMQGSKPDERIRTPMQWDGSERAGFTTGRPWERLAAGHETLNVAVQDDDPDSLLNHYRELIRLRQEHPALSAGDMTLVTSNVQQVYSFLRRTPQETLLVLVNLSGEPVSEYALTLESGALNGATLLLGEGELVAPTLNAAGGLDAFAPLRTLPPRSSAIIRLGP